ncbi:MAG: trigger factor [Clostridiales bacterium]|nr:trigger factor [Clostridiales bacterium]
MSEDNVRVSGVEQLEPNKVKIMFSIGPDRFEKAVADTYEENKRRLRIPGFRAGKAPRKLIEARYGKDFFYEDAINNILPAVYEEMLTSVADELEPVSRPIFKLESADTAKGAEFSAEVWVKPEAVVSSYTGLEYPRINMEVTEDDIDREIAFEREKNARYSPVSERGLKNGDITRINFEGFIDGVPFDGGKSEDYELVIGSGRFIPGFEEQMIGMTVGETRLVDVNFPDDYHAEHLKGKPARFEVTLNEAHEKEVPEADDDFAQNVSEFDTFAEYREDMRERLLERREHDAKREKEEFIITELVKRTEVNVPEVMIGAECEHIIQNFERSLYSQGMSFDRFMESSGHTEESLFQSYLEPARRNVTARLALETVAKKEGFTATEEDIDAELNSMTADYGLDVEKLKETLTKRERDSMVLDIIVQKALKHVTENAVEIEPSA